jgi:DNA-binding MarR family transcriptional regulator
MHSSESINRPPGKMIPGNLSGGAVTDVTQVFNDLVRAETRLYNAVGERLRAVHDLSLGQYELLQIIDGHPDCRVLDIVRAVAITVGAASKAVDRLEGAGWCLRTAHPTDRRSSIVTLTPAGEAMLAAARPTFREAVAAILAAVPSDALASAAVGLEALRVALEDRQREVEASPG